MQNASEVQDTLLSVCGHCVPAGLGVFSVVQEVPFQTAEAMLNSPSTPFVPAPTPTHTLTVGHATPCSSVMPDGDGSMVQECPSHDSASEISTCAVVVYSPAARQFDGPIQATADKVLPADPGGTTGGLRVQDLPFQTCASAVTLRFAAGTDRQAPVGGQAGYSHQFGVTRNGRRGQLPPGTAVPRLAELSSPVKVQAADGDAVLGRDARHPQQAETSLR